MADLPKLKIDELFQTGDAASLWQKYCGFLDFSLNEFMVVQKALLMDQIELLANCELGQKLLKGQKPRSAEEFRKVCPLTNYDSYKPYLDERIESALPAKTGIWAHTSGRTGQIKWVPFSMGNLERLAEDTLSAFILSSANRKGEVLLHPGVRVVLNLPPVQYTTGLMGYAAGQRMPYRAIPPLEIAEKMDFQERTREGFKMALTQGADYAASIAVVLAKVGEMFSQMGRDSKTSLTSLNPMMMLRVMRGMLRSKLARRPMLPRDIWRMKGLVCGGTDTSIYQEQIAYYWGIRPLDVYVSTETGFIAMNGWNKRWLTFVPYTNFYEFISLEEQAKSRADSSYEPKTLLLDELEVGKVYELVVTNFHGGPFMRYRIGDLMKVTAAKDEQTGVNLPQMMFQSRADDVIDIAGFARLDEKTIWQAIQSTGMPYEDFTVRKESIKDISKLHVYIELHRNTINQQEVEQLIDQKLIESSTDYWDFRRMTNIQPVSVTLLNRGTFQKYLKKKQSEGFDLAHLKPAHINAPDKIIQELLQLGQN